MIRKLLQLPALYALSFWCIALILLVLLTDWVVMPIVSGRLVSTKEMPSVIGMPGEKAQSEIEALGLKVEWNPEGRYSSDIPAGSVLIQMPGASSTVKKGRTVYLTVSKGVREVAVPELRGRSQRQAEITLGRLGLVVDKTIPGAHSSIPRGVVIRTEPPEGKLVRMGSAVSIIISSGSFEGRIKLPDLIGLSMDRSFQLLDSLGLRTGEVKRQADSTKLPNTVLEHSPRSGEYLDPGSIIDMVVVD